MKENTKHMPGTWRQGTPFLGKDTLLCLSIVDDSGRGVATVYGCGNGGVDAGFPPDDEARRYAALIAAAPDLLAACKLAVRFVEDVCKGHQWPHENCEAWKAATAAIAKAKGE